MWTAKIYAIMWTAKIYARQMTRMPDTTII
jgi:hypothetical protein